MKKAYEIFRSELDSIKEAGTYKDERIITTPQKARIDTTVAKGVLNMCANNYLGLSNNPEVIAAAKASYDEWGFGLRTFHLRHSADPQAARTQNRRFSRHG